MASVTITDVVLDAVREVLDSGAPQQNLGNNAQQHLKSFVERIERLEEEKAGISNNIKEVYAEAKGNGFNAKVLKEIIKLRAMSEDERIERDALIATYMHALGMSVQPNLPGVE